MNNWLAFFWKKKNICINLWIRGLKNTIFQKVSIDRYLLLNLSQNNAIIFICFRLVLGTTSTTTRRVFVFIVPLRLPILRRARSLKMSLSRWILLRISYLVEMIWQVFRYIDGTSIYDMTVGHCEIIKIIQGVRKITARGFFIQLEELIECK